MKLNLKYRPGARAIKSAIAVFLCLLIGYILKRDSMFYGAIAAVICLQQTYDESKNAGIHRFIGTCIGGVAGYFSLRLLLLLNEKIDWIYVFINAFGILIIIYLCNFFEVKASTTIACIVFLNVVTNFERGMNDAFLYVFFRVIDTTIGIIIAVVINRIRPPKDEEKAQIKVKEA